ncbi:hypothetical protein [Polynucleobacter necessarius]|uniref:hypothetical protein n=1 Tax=Polynucleobacter necessarius TaxID=576610 RepID=UPI000E09164C|nr:hypothetical protein [Polynucleobacter necessarius]
MAISTHDCAFKQLLDQYKYPNHYPEIKQETVLQEASELMLKPMEVALQQHRYLLGNGPSLIAIQFWVWSDPPDSTFRVGLL